MDAPRFCSKKTTKEKYFPGNVFLEDSSNKLFTPWFLFPLLAGFFLFYLHLLSISFDEFCFFPFYKTSKLPVKLFNQTVKKYTGYETQSTLPGAFPYGGHNPLNFPVVYIVLSWLNLVSVMS